MQGVKSTAVHDEAVAHVVYVWPYIEWGGAQRYLMAIMRRAVGRARVTAIVPVASDPALVTELERLGVVVTYMRGRLAVTRPASLARRVTQHVRAWQAQVAMWRSCQRVACRGTVFHCDVPITLFTAVLLALARRHGVVVTLHTPFRDISKARSWAWRQRIRALTRQPRFRLVAANQSVRNSLRPLLSNAALGDVPIAYSPVERTEVMNALHTGDRAETRRWLGVGDGRFLVVTGAQFIERKGCSVWLDAAARVRAGAADVDFVWLGPAPVTSQDAARLEALRGVVRYVPQVKLPDGRRSYLQAVAAADAFVLPSLEEGLPLALVEAMALGVPVITTPVNAIPEAVEHGVTGWLVPPGDATALADAIVHLRDNPMLAERLAAAARAHARSFDAEEVARITLAVYATCVQPNAQDGNAA